MNSKVRTFAAAMAVLALAACGKKVVAPVEEDDVYVDRDTLVMYMSDPKGGIPEVPSTPTAVALGKLLFSEQKLAKAGDVSCASCHDPAKHFAAPGMAKSKGAGGVATRRNVPGLVNAARNGLFFWDYRANNIEDAVAMHATEPTTYGFADDGAQAENLTRKLKDLASAKDGFAKAFPDDKEPANAVNFARAIGAYLRTLTAKTRFDAYLDGDDAALDNKEKKGLKLFTSVLNCMSCHNSRLVGGMLQNKFGTLKPYESPDLGRFEVSKKPEDKHMYKVPSLVNVTRTAPYFHDGSATTLEAAITTMSVHQFGRAVEPGELAEVAAFLGALDAK